MPATRPDTTRHVRARGSTARHDSTRHDVIRCDTMRKKTKNDAIRCDTMRFDTEAGSLSLSPPPPNTLMHCFRRLCRRTLSRRPPHARLQHQLRGCQSFVARDARNPILLTRDSHPQVLARSGYLRVESDVDPLIFRFCVWAVSGRPGAKVASTRMQVVP